MVVAEPPAGPPIVESHQPNKPPPRNPRRPGLDRILLVMSVLMGAVSHGYNIFNYPLYITDEGIYIQQAWSVLREDRLSPYTYFYDHAPGGWLVIAGWVALLPGQFQTFGNAINTGRMLMLICHILSTFLLFQITLHLTGSRAAAVLASFLFDVSPLAIFYQRQVLLDNVMVTWLLLTVFLLTGGRNWRHGDLRIVAAILSGLTFGVAVLTKENAVFFAPPLMYALVSRLKGRMNYRFSFGFWSFSAASSISI